MVGCERPTGGGGDASSRVCGARRALIDEGWANCIVHALYSKIGLFLGLSGDDSANPQGGRVAQQ